MAAPKNMKVNMAARFEDPEEKLVPTIPVSESKNVFHRNV